MDIYLNLPPELQNKVKYFALEHPTAKVIKDTMDELNCNLAFTFKEKGGKTVCKIDGRDFFANEYFAQLNDESPTPLSDEIFHTLFDVTSSTSEEEG